MFLGPLRWPPRWVWIAAAVLTVVTGLLLLLGVVGQAIFVAMIVVALIMAGNGRLKALGADEMRDSRPDE